MFAHPEAKDGLSETVFHKLSTKELGAVNPVHMYVGCDGCGESPVMNFRFKCANCDDFDLCLKCFRAEFGDTAESAEIKEKLSGGGHGYRKHVFIRATDWNRMQ